ncbi:MAG: hypothetical protein A3I66_17790 [Burkholderiales bacterium RIFCSPLOWO2_02_FULL_57_36]|nr:MAG: hypothetical protein A3I66_17790 [Burkholderiales bacterium RIFCSPLOWO2_02_FULL_57_36]
MLLKIGELAKRTGITVRTLHHYDDIGLLAPSARSDSGYRLYDRLDLAKLYRIQVLRRLDLPLSEIQDILAGDGARLPDVVAQQIVGLGRQIAQATEFRNRLLMLQEQLANKDEPSLDAWLTTLEVMATYAKYFSEDELARLRKHSEQFPGNGVLEHDDLVTAFRELIDRGVSPESPEASALANRWTDMLERHAGGNPGLIIKLFTMQSNEPSVQALTGVDQPMLDYISHATAYTRLEIYVSYLQPDELAVIHSNYTRHLAEWPRLIGALRHQMEQGASAESADVQALARQWLAMSHAAGDVQLKLREAFFNESRLRASTGIEPDMILYVGEAIAHLLYTASD